MSTTHNMLVQPAKVTVNCPGRGVPGGESEAFLLTIDQQLTSKVAPRARAYASGGRVRKLMYADGTFTAFVIGSGEVYATTVGGFVGAGKFVATCECFYGCREKDWCKHAGAVAYAAGALLDGKVSGNLTSVIGLSQFEHDCAASDWQTRLAEQKAAAEKKRAQVQRQKNEQKAQQWVNAQKLTAPVALETFDCEKVFEDACLWLAFPTHV